MMTDTDTDFLIDHIIASTAIEEGVSPSWLAANGKLPAGVKVDPALPRRHRSAQYSPYELRFIRANLGKLTYDEIGACLGRSGLSVKIQQVRRRMPAPSKLPNTLTGNQTARALGIDIHSVMMLHRRGLLPMLVLAGEKGILSISRLRLYMWAVNPEHWIYFKVNLMRDKKLQRLVTLAQARWPDRWLSTGQVAKYLGLPPRHHNLVNKHIIEGKIPAVRWGNWWVKRSAIECYVFYIGKGAKGYSRIFTPAADAFLLRSVAAGLSYCAIARLMKISSHQTIANRHRYLKERNTK